MRVYCLILNNMVENYFIKYSYFSISVTFRKFHFSDPSYQLFQKKRTANFTLQLFCSLKKTCTKGHFIERKLEKSMKHVLIMAHKRITKFIAESACTLLHWPLYSINVPQKKSCTMSVFVEHMR